MPDSENEEDIRAAKAKTFAQDINHYLLNWWLDPIMYGDSGDDDHRIHPRMRAALSDEDIAIIHQPLDFIGWNCYLANNYNEGPDGRMPVYWPGIPRTNMGWPVTPDALYWGVRFIYERYNIPVMISENGIAIVDFVMDDGCVHDPQRIQFMKWYLRGNFSNADAEAACGKIEALAEGAVIVADLDEAAAKAAAEKLGAVSLLHVL
jgi:beta-glucosidase